MASQVLSGASNPSYTNNTGQNVRVVINYMQGAGSITLNWAGVSVSSPLTAIGRNLAVAEYYVEPGPRNVSRSTTSASGNDRPSVAESQSTFTGFGLASNTNALAVKNTGGVLYQYPNTNTQGAIISGAGALPTELILAAGQTFSAVCGVYNIVVIPEEG